MIRFRTEGLNRMNLRWWGPTKEDWIPTLIDDQLPFWRKEVDPTTGQPWARLTPRYAAKKAKEFPGAPILRATGTMLDSFYISESRNRFSVNSTFYGKYHQFGTSRMVARPWVGIPDTSLEKLSAISWENILSNYS